jgi:hypothetical protein
LLSAAEDSKTPAAAFYQSHAPGVQNGLTQHANCNKISDRKGHSHCYTQKGIKIATRFFSFSLCKFLILSATPLFFLRKGKENGQAVQSSRTSERGESLNANTSQLTCNHMSTTPSTAWLLLLQYSDTKNRFFLIVIVDVFLPHSSSQSCCSVVVATAATRRGSLLSV